VIDLADIKIGGNKISSAYLNTMFFSSKVVLGYPAAHVSFGKFLLEN
jgi:hypothetical protein